MQNICDATVRIGLCIPRLACSQKVAVRYGRKPSWLGFAKTKEFRVPPPKNWPKNETEEMYLLTQHYYTYMKSLSVFQQKMYERSVEESMAHAKEISEDGEIGKILEEIERDNAIVRSIRETELIKEWKEIEVDIIKQRTLAEETEILKQEATEHELKFNMERLKSAIRDDALNEAIDKALNSMTDHNFAIDKQGNYYFGRHNGDNPTEKRKLSTIGLLE